MNDLATQPTTELTDEQKAAVEFIRANAWKGLVALAGPAGSGKTTVIKSLVEAFKGPVTVCATTNKAAVVLRRKGLDAVTLHQACMAPLFKPPLDDIAKFLNESDEKNVKYPNELKDEYTQEQLFQALIATKRSGINSGMRSLGIRDVFKYVSGWLPSGHKDGVLIVDEASMLGDRDLDIVQQVFDRIVLVGDEYQLPPVKDSPAFWLVENRVSLNQIHRQAEGSQPLQIATKIRNGEPIVMSPRQKIDYELCRSGMPVLVWRNATRERLTVDIRKNLGFDGLPPQEGEYLICRNGQDKTAKEIGFHNNSMWKVISSDGYYCELENDDGERHSQHVYIEEFDQGDGLPFRFAYALTAHNSQGSEWPTVMINVPDASAWLGRKDGDGRKGVYTQVTRGKECVKWVI